MNPSLFCRNETIMFSEAGYFIGVVDVEHGDALIQIL
jgi:hypothetical protein